MTRFILFSLLLLSFCMAVPVSLLADDDDEIESQIFVPPGSAYTPTAANIANELKKLTMPRADDKIEVNFVTVSIVHYHYMEPDQFGLLLKAPNLTSGCYEVSPLEYEVNFVAEQFMDVKIKNYRRKIVKTKNISNCDTSNKAVTGLIVLNARDLQKRGIQEIRFDNGSFRDIYKLSYTEDSIVLKPESMVAFRAQDLTGPDKDRLTYYYSSNQIVALHVPMAREGENIRSAVDRLALQNSLMPIYDQEGLDLNGTNHIYFYRDSQGRALDMLNDQGYAELGTIRIPRPFIGEVGQNALPVALKVFVARPETTL